MAAPMATLDNVVSMGIGPKPRLWTIAGRGGKFGYIGRGFGRACDIKQKRTQERYLNVKHVLDNIPSP